MWPIVAAGGAVLGSVLQYEGGRQTNASNENIAARATEANMAEAARNRAFQAEQVKAQMDFQERMSSTAHQRETADMIAAGINPMIGKNQGASTPSGGAAGGDSGNAVSATMQNPFHGFNSAFTNAVEAYKSVGEIEMQAKQRALLDAQIKESGSRTDLNQRYIPETKIKNRFYQYLEKMWDSLETRAKDSWKNNGAGSVLGNRKKFNIDPWDQNLQNWRD